MSIFNKKYKDSVFTDLFGSDKDGKKNFLMHFLKKTLVNLNLL